MATGHWQRARRRKYQDKVVVRCQGTARKQQVLGRSPVLVYCQRATGATCKAMQETAMQGTPMSPVSYPTVVSLAKVVAKYRTGTVQYLPGTWRVSILGRPWGPTERNQLARPSRGRFAEEEMERQCKETGSHWFLVLGEQLAAGWTRNRLGRVLLLVWKCAREPRLLFLSLWKTSEA